MNKTETGTSPKTPNLRRKCWWIIRKQKSITETDLALAIADNELPHRQKLSLRHWLLRLHAVGILEVAREYEKGGVYRITLTEDIGKLCPVLRPDNSIYNPNAQVVL